MTIKPSGELGLYEIDAAFSLGKDLASYRGVAWWKDDGSSGSFSLSGISFYEFYSKRKDAPEPPTIKTNQVELNLRTWAINNGWDGYSAAVVKINSGVVISSTNINKAALTIDGSWPNGLQLINYGIIIGKGGTGGTSPTDTSSNGTAGTSGGLGITLGCAVTISNYGIIGGGGGGGGSGGYDATLVGSLGPGGGGGGAGFGAAGLGVYGQLATGSNGTAGSASAGGAGGAGGHWTYGNNYSDGGRGGDGGGPGASGGGGAAGMNNGWYIYRYGGAGGGPGKCIALNGCTLVWSPEGNHYGAIS